jgi:hypothetical protein
MSNCSRVFKITYNLLKLVIIFLTNWRKPTQVFELIMTQKHITSLHDIHRHAWRNFHIRTTPILCLTQSRHHNKLNKVGFSTCSKATWINWKWLLVLWCKNNLHMIEPLNLKVNFYKSDNLVVLKILGCWVTRCWCNARVLWRWPSSASKYNIPIYNNTTSN